ncbi:MAG: ABC transporter substrate-binding protein [Clostridiales bacterium]|nr:ABC transporter substrate-binding protein [Clostridiales bacterium]
MKKKIMIWVYILALLTALVGCSKGIDNKQQTKPVTQANSVSQTESYDGSEPQPFPVNSRYVENEIPQPEMDAEEYRIGSRVNCNNQYEIYTALDSEDRTNATVYCYTLVEDKFIKSTVEWASNACKDLAITPESLCQSEDGNDYIQFTKSRLYDNHFYGTRMVIKKTEDAKGYLDVTPSYWHETASKLPYCDSLFIRSLKITKNQIMCYTEEGGLELVFYDIKKKEKVDFGSINIYQHYALKDNTIYTFSDKPTELLVHDLEEGKTDSIELQYSNGAIFEKLIEIGPNNEIIVLDQGGLHIKMKNGTLWETIVDGDQCSVSTPNFLPESLVILPDSTITYFAIYANIVDYKNDKYVKYEPIMDDSMTSSKELKICSLFDNATMRMGIANFKKKHPEIKVSYDILFDTNSTDAAATRAEIIRTLNVELLAGKGPDIMLLDYLPISSFVEKGVLMDLSNILNGPDQENLLLSNISDCYNQDGKMYCMPIRILLPYYGSREDLGKQTMTVEDLATYCKDKDRKVIASATYFQLAHNLLMYYSDEIFSEDGLIKKEGLTSFLSSMNIIANQIKAVPGAKTNKYSTGVKEDYYQTIPDSLMSEDSTIAVMNEIGSIAQLESLIAILREIGGNYVPINQSFFPYGIVGINNMTKQPELAKEFVTSLFDEDIQSKDLQDGIPVNEKALMNWNIPCRKLGCTSYQTLNGEVKLINIDSLTVDDMKKFTDYVKSLTRSAYTDEDSRDIIAEGAAEYLEGNMTLEQAVDDIIQKYNLYFGE